MIDTLADEDMTHCYKLLRLVAGLEGSVLHQQLGELASAVCKYSGVAFSQDAPAQRHYYTQDVQCDDIHYGYYILPIIAADVSEQDQQRIGLFAEMTGRLMHLQEQIAVAQGAVMEMDVRLAQKKQILDQINQSVLTTDPAGFITSWNHGAEKMFGYTAAEALGRNVLFLYDENEDDDSILQQNFMHDEQGEIEVRRRRKSGEIFWAGMSMSVMRDDAGQPSGMIGYISDITKRKNAEERIHQLAFFNGLTGLPNRANLINVLDGKIALDKYGEEKIHCVMYIDLNRFRSINYTLGHVIGDKLLLEAASRIKGVISQGDFLVHLGGDKFSLIIGNVETEYHVGFVAQTLLGLFEESFKINGYELRVGVSIGVSMYPQDGRDAETLLRQAEIAMYKVQREHYKDSGYAYYREEMNYQNLSQLRTEIDLGHAIDNNELFLQYQPKVNMTTGEIIGAEALIRWRHPEHGVLYPNEFIPIAEETGIIRQLSEWVLETVCAQAKCWQDEGLPLLRVALNLAAPDFTRTLPERVQRALEKHGLAGEWLELEVTESMLMKDTDDVIMLMDKICELGVTIALDDFGTGYSNLSYLKRFPIQTMKMDRSFTIGIPEDCNSCAIANAIINIAKQLDQKVVAEGVEDMQQLAFLREAGCDELQGYIFSKPVMPEEFRQMVLDGARLDLGCLLASEGIKKLA